MKTPEQQQVIEQKVRAALEGGMLDQAATLSIESYGSEILGFLHAMCQDEDLLGESFSQFCEDVWKGIGRFEWRSSFRTWLYALSRNALYRTSRGERRRKQRERPMATWMDAQEQLRSATMVFLRTTVKDRMMRIRESLPKEDQELLILRVDRQLDWKDLAQVMAAEELSEEATKREAARLRKRFQLVKERLRDLAQKEGLLDEGDAPS